MGRCTRATKGLRYLGHGTYTAVRKDNIEIMHWIYSNRPERRSCEALGEAVVYGQLDMAVWSYANYPKGYFDDRWKASCDMDLIHWVAREHKWIEDVHRTVCVDNAIVLIVGQDPSCRYP